MSSLQRRLSASTPVALARRPPFVRGSRTEKFYHKMLFGSFPNPPPFGFPPTV